MVGMQFASLSEKLTAHGCGHKRNDKEQTYATKYHEDCWKCHGYAMSRLHAGHGPIPGPNATPASRSTYVAPNRQYHTTAGPQAGYQPYDADL